MTALPRRAAGLVRRSTEEKRAAERILGRGHPLARALARESMLANQSLAVAAAVLMGVVAVLVHVDIAPLAVVVGGAVGSVFVFAWALAHATTRARTWDLIAAGDDGVVLGVVVRERSRLASRKERERLARSLESCLLDAQRSGLIVPAWRPLPGVEALRHLAPEVARVTALLRADHARVQGVASTVLLLTDGVDSPLYGGDVERLREELNRIRYQLEAPRPRADSETVERAAA